MTLGTGEDFVVSLLGVLNSGMLSLMIGIGHRTGLFDTMAALPPSGSADIAEAAGLDERYVREWLGAMTTGRIVGHDPVALTFWLPPEHAASLTRAAGSGHLAVAAEYVGLVAQVEDQVVECFYRGGAYLMPPSRNDGWRMRPSSAAWAWTPPFRDHPASRPRSYRAPPSRHRRRRYRVRFGPAPQPDGRRLPSQPVRGLGLLRAGSGGRQSRGVPPRAHQRQLREAGAASLDGSERFDFITTFDAVHDQARPDLVLAGIARSLRPEGATYVSTYESSNWRTTSTTHSRLSCTASRAYTA